MTTFNIAVQIGASLTQGFRSAIRGSTGQLNQLGQSLDKLKRQQAAIRRIEISEGNVGQARVAYNAAVGDVVRLRRELAQTQNPSRQLTQSFEAAKQKAERLSGALAQQRQRLQKAKQALRETGLSTERLTADNRRLGQSVDKLNRQYGRLGKAMRAQQANQARRAELRGQLFDAVAIGATVVAPLNVAVQFEQSVAKLGAITKCAVVTHGIERRVDHCVCDFITTVLRAGHPIIQRRSRSGQTALRGIANLRTVTEKAITTCGIDRQVRHQIEHFITEIRRASHSIVDRRRRSGLAPQGCVTGLLTVTERRVITKTILR